MYNTHEQTSAVYLWVGVAAVDKTSSSILRLCRREYSYK